jgi:hypothetical protein
MSHEEVRLLDKCQYSAGAVSQLVCRCTAYLHSKSRVSKVKSFGVVLTAVFVVMVKLQLLKKLIEALQRENGVNIKCVAEEG